MENINLMQGICPICQKPISPDWTSSPLLGQTCRDDYNNKSQVFSAANIDFSEIKANIVFNPLTGTYGYSYDWSGAKVKVNGRVGIVGYVQGDGCIVKYTDDPHDIGRDWLAIGYFDFRQMYRSSGLETALPVLEFNPPDLLKADLLPEPILPLEVSYKSDGSIYSVQVDKLWLKKGMTPFHLIYQFCNFYVRSKFGLEPSFSAEGGFAGKGVEICNLHDRVGLRDSTDWVMTEWQKNFAQTVFLAWIEMAQTLLRQSWENQPLTNVTSIWAAFVKIQALALNVMGQDELSALLSLARHHAANPYSPRI